MAQSTNTWRDKFKNAAQTGSVAQMVSHLQGEATSHAGTAPAKVKQQAIRILTKAHRDNAEGLHFLALSLCDSGNASAEEVGIMLLSKSYSADPPQVTSQLLRLSNSDNWEVREWAASACGEVLCHHFTAFYPILQDWVHCSEENVRRAVVLAAMYAGQGQDAADTMPIEKLLDLLAPLLADESKYVRDNLGPFALGSGLMKYHADVVLSRMRDWIALDGEIIHWNLAMVFTAAAGAQHAAKAKDLLAQLHADPRTMVRRAMAKALRQISKYDASLIEEIQAY